MKKFWLVLMSIILTIGIIFTGCRNDIDDDDEGDDNELICVEHTFVVKHYDVLSEGIDPETGELVSIIDTESGVLQTWRECTKCGFVTYPELPGGVEPPAGAVWLGQWIEDTAQQIKWEVTDELKAKIKTGEFNRLYLYIDKSKIHQNAGSTQDGRYLSSISMIVNATKTDDTATWQQIRPIATLTPSVTHIPSSIMNLDTLELPCFTLIDHIPEHNKIDWDGFFQFYIQHTSSGGGIVNLWPVALFVGPALPGDPVFTPIPTDPVNIEIDVDGEDQQVLVKTRGGAVVALEGENGYQFGWKGSGHRSSFAYFEVDLGTGTLSDFEKIEFEFETTGDGSSRVALIASIAEPASLSTHATGGSGQGSGLGSDNGYLAAGQVTLPIRDPLEVNTPLKMSLTIVSSVGDFEETFTDTTATNALNATGKIWLSIYEHTGSGAINKVSNIVLVPRDPETPIYRITATPSSVDFGSVAFGYTDAPAAQAITINNTGNQDVGHLSVTLTAGADNFKLIPVSPTIASIAAGESATDAFSIQPLDGLTDGNYSATVTVSGGSGETAVLVNITLSFEVLPEFGEPTLSWTINPADDTVTRIGTNNHVLRLRNMGPIPETTTGGTLTINYLAGQNAGSNRRIVAWTDLSGDATEIKDFSFATADNLSAGKTARTDPRLVSSDTVGNITIPASLLYDEGTGKAATEFYIILATDSDTSVVGNQRGGGSNNEFARLGTVVLTLE